MMIKPVKRIPLSDKDKQFLERIQENKTAKNHAQPEHYRNKVVVKPWGYEFLIFENEWVAIWFLFIKKDHSTSMHCHPTKKTSLALLSGKALCNTFRHRNFLSPGDSLIISAAVFHSTKALSLDGIALIEVETPPDKVDLVRLEDNYNRENCGYEDCSQMATENLRDYGYFHFEEQDCHGKKFTLDNRYSISIESYSFSDGFPTSFNLDPGSLYCVCKGEILGPDKKAIAKVGDTERGGYLKQLGSVGLNQETILMKFAVYD